MDPIDLRVGNDPAADPDTGKPFGDRRLLECLRIGAERFGWADRPSPGGRLDGDWRIGYGVAASTYPGEACPATPPASRRGKHGRHTVAIAASDIGTGARTALALVAADALGLDPGLIDVELGDSTLPMATVAGGSSGTDVVGNGDRRGGQRLPRRARRRPGREGATTTAKAPSIPAREEFANHSFGAQFVELAVHRLTGEPRVRRMLGIFSVGRVVNPRGARSQLVGGMVMGMSVGLFEESFRDPRFGHVVTQDLATYHVAANADVPDIEVDWLDPGTGAAINPMGSRGIGEIGIVGTSAAIANAAYNATGVRVRSLPVTADHFLGLGPRGRPVAPAVDHVRTPRAAGRRAGRPGVGTRWPTVIAPIGLRFSGTPKASRNASVRAPGTPKKQAPRPSSTAVWRIRSAAIAVSMCQ